MTTKNLVPRATGEGSLGTSSLKWGSINALTGSFDATQFEALKNGADNDLLVAGNNVTITYASGANGNQYTIEASSTPITGVLEDLETLGTSAAADGAFIVATGAGAFAYESGATARTSLGLGTIATEDINLMPALIMAGAIAMGTNKITGLGTPTADTDAATKAYVDGVAQGLDIYDTVVAATTASFTMASTASTTTLVLADGEGGFNASADTFTVDNVSLSQGDRVLIKDGVNSNNTGDSDKWNGIYTVGDLTAASLTLTRAADMDVPSEFNTGAFFFVEQGDTNDDNGFVLTTDGTVTVGTSNIEFTQFSGAGAITAGGGLSKTGNTLSIDIPNQAEMTGDVADTDELLISDAGTLKRADFSIIRDAVFNDVSGDATIAAGGALTVDKTIISGQTEETSIADDDLVLIYDDSASVLRKMTKANFVSGISATVALDGISAGTSSATLATTGDITFEVNGSNNDFIVKTRPGGSQKTAFQIYTSFDGSEEQSKFHTDVEIVSTNAGPLRSLNFHRASAFDLGKISATTGSTTIEVCNIEFKRGGNSNEGEIYFNNAFSGGTLATALKIHQDLNNYRIVDITEHDGSSRGLALGGDLVKATADELNILDGVTATTAELNVLDGDTTASSTILDANDRVVVNDAGTMKQVTMTDVMTYVNANVSGGSVALDDIGVGDAASTLATTAGNITIDAQGTDTDIIFKGTTGGVDTTFLTLDGSDGGTAIFNSDINLQHTGARIYFGATDQTIITHQQQTGLIISLGGDLHSNEPRLTLSSTGSTNNKGPQLYFTFDTTASHAPSDDDVVGSLKFQGDAGKIYGLIENAIENASNPSGRFDFYVAANNGDVGSYGPVFTIKGSTTTYGEGIVELGGNLDVNGNDIVTTSNADLDLAPDGTGVVVLKGNTTGGNNPGAIKLNCE
jgi:hypothetical protein